MERAIGGIAAIKGQPDKEVLIQKLQNEVYALQRNKKVQSVITEVELGPIIHAFPKNIFPVGAIHEFISYEATHAAATTGFMMGLSAQLMQTQGNCLWVSTNRILFPSALKHFGINASRIIFIDLTKPKDVLWAVEEALKCSSLSLVIGEVSDISFNDSRRLQLAVEQSNVTGLLHRFNPRMQNTLASVAKWKVMPVASSLAEELPGVGFSRWRVELLKVRNGKPDVWEVEWSENSYQFITTQTIGQRISKRKTA